MAVTERLDPNADKNTIKFLGFDLTGQPMTYLLKMKNPEMVKDFVEAVQKEVSELKK